MNNEMDNIKKTTNLSTKESRRKFIKNTAIVAPILTTVTSKSVFADDYAINSISGNLSNNQSGPEHEPNYENGCSPGYWHKVSRYKLYTAAETKFNAIFTSLPVNFPSDLANLPIVLVAANGATNPIDDGRDSTYISLYPDAYVDLELKNNSTTEVKKLSAKIWSSNDIYYKVARVAAATYMNAEFNYITYEPTQVVYFFSTIGSATGPTWDEAFTILANLIHGGPTNLEDGSCAIAGS